MTPGVVVVKYIANDGASGMMCVSAQQDSFCKDNTVLQDFRGRAGLEEVG